MDNAPNEPISVTVMSGTGDGTVHATTLGSTNPDATVTYIKPVVGILIKGLKAFFGSLATGLGSESVGFVSIDLETILKLAVGTAVVVMVTATASYLGELEKKFPIIGA